MEHLGELTDIDYSIAIPNHEDYTSSALCVLHQLIYEVGDEYKIPIKLATWLWFLGNVVPFPCRHSGYVFASSQFPDWLHFLKDQLYSVNYEIERLCRTCFWSDENPLPFQLRFNAQYGVSVISLTSDYKLLYHSLQGFCFPIPPKIVSRIESEKNFAFLHANGIITGPIAFLNHECSYPVVFGFDWEEVAPMEWSAVPCYLSYNLAYDKNPCRLRKNIPDSRFPTIQVGDEVYVAYFNEVGAIDGDQDWFNQAKHCLCRKCLSIRSEGKQKRKRKKVRDIESLPVIDDVARCIRVKTPRRKKPKKPAGIKKPKVLSEVKEWIRNQQRFHYIEEERPYVGLTRAEIRESMLSFVSSKFSKYIK